MFVYRCVPVACEIADGSLWNVSVCFFIGVHRLLGRFVTVACGMYRSACYRCVSVAWEIADGSLWNVSVCCLSVCVGCLGDRAYCFPIVLPHLLPILPLLHNAIYCSIEPALAPNVKEMQQNAIHLRHPGCPLNGLDDKFY